MTTHRQLLEQARNTLEKARDIVNPGLSPEHAAWWAELARSIHDIDTYLSKPEPVALMSDAEDARSGVQSISAGFDDPPFNGCPPDPGTIDGTLHPVAYCIYIAADPSQYYVQDLDEACDDLTNCECEVTPLADHATATKYIANLQAEIASMRGSMNRLRHAAEEIERALCAQVCIDLGRDDCAEAILARGKGEAIAGAPVGPELPDHIPMRDAADYWRKAARGNWVLCNHLRVQLQQARGALELALPLAEAEWGHYPGTTYGGDAVAKMRAAIRNGRQP